MTKKTEELRKKLEDLEAFETSAEIGLDLLAALEAVEELCKLAESGLEYGAGGVLLVDEMRNEIKKALEA